MYCLFPIILSLVGFVNFKLISTNSNNSLTNDDDKQPSQNVNNNLTDLNNSFNPSSDPKLPTQTPTVPNINFNTLKQAQFIEHNRVRVLHKVPVLTLDPTIGKIAQAYADKLCKQIKTLKHSGNSLYGENLYWGWGSPQLNYASKAASMSWYSQNVNYNYQTGLSANGMTIGHFTAMVWKSVTKVGFGFCLIDQSRGSSKSQAIYVVANYYPPPNYFGQYTKNVFPPK